jgi:hypothetical protein
MTDQEVYSKLTASFPSDAYSVDSSRGFDLTSVKAQYVVERLNEVFGFMNWTHTGEYKEVEDGVLFLGTLSVTVNGKTNTQFAPGFSKDKKNLGDAYKGAKTDSLSKSASMIGVANDVFKGLVSAKDVKAGKASTTAHVTVATVTATNPVVETKPTSFQTRSAKRSTKTTISTSDDI